jgi:hypothetical protein
MMTDKQLVLEDFADKVGSAFLLNEQGLDGMSLTLQEAEALNPAMGLRGARPPFSLIFVGKDPRVLPQRIYQMEHEKLGEIALFLVPVGKNAEGVSYQATFN